MSTAPSPFLRLPASLDRRQVLFFDGIRHASDMSEVAYARLVDELTAIGLAAHRHETPQAQFPAAFLDAWSLVDALDRLRGLLGAVPGLDGPADPRPAFLEETAGIRGLRNVSDHIATKVDYVRARKGTALGKLRWITVVSEQPPRVMSCAIVPGTVTTGDTFLINPLTRDALQGPTDMVTLAAGEHEVCLSDAIAAARRVMRALERALDDWIAASGLADQRAGADMLITALMELLPDDTGGPR